MAPIVKPITKYVTMVTDPQSIRYHLEKAIYLATNGRPGPCWLDIPLDVQAAMIDPDTLEGFDPAELDEPWKATDVDEAARDVHALKVAREGVFRAVEALARRHDDAHVAERGRLFAARANAHAE